MGTWSGAGNVGDELLTAWAVDQLRARGAHPVVTSVDADVTRRHHGAVATVPWGLRPLPRRPRIDGVLVGPGGIVQDSSSVWSLPAHLARAVHARSRGLPVAGVGLGAEPLLRRFSRRLVRRALGAAVGVSVRDEASRAALAGAGVGCTVGADVVFDLVSDAPAAPPGPGEGHLVVAVGPGVRPGRVRPARWRLEADDPGPAASAVRAVAGRLGCGIVIVAFRGARDRAHAHRLAPLLDGVRVDDTGDPDRVRTLIASARAVVSSRFHPCVLAVAAGVPALAVSGQAKVRSLVDSVDDPSRLGLAADWTEAASWDPGPPTAGRAPAPAEAHHRVLDALVAAARAHGPPQTRRRASGG